MIRVEIPVTKLTRKILIYKFGERVVLRPNDPQLVLFSFIPLFRGKILCPSRSDLITSLQVTLPNAYKSHLNKYGTYLGGPIHRYYMREINEYVFSEWSAGKKALQALKEYRDIRNINEDDFPLESAYKSFNRFKKKKTEQITAQKRGATVLEIPTQEITIILPPENVILHTTAQAFDISVNDLVGPSNKTELSRIRSALCFVLHNYGQLSFRKIAKMLKRNNASWLCKVNKEIIFLKDRKLEEYPEIPKILKAM